MASKSHANEAWDSSLSEGWVLRVPHHHSPSALAKKYFASDTAAEALAAARVYYHGSNKHSYLNWLADTFLLQSEVSTSDLEKEFNELAEQWYLETRMFSFIRQKAMHIAYQNIIGMGKDALPFIFRELSKGKGDWIYAIERITRLKENPVPGNATFKETIAIWLDWATKNDYFTP